MCSHLYAASELYNLSLIPQNKVKAKKFVFRVAKSKKSLLDKTQQLVVESIALNKRTVRNNELISQSNVEAVVEPVQPKVTRSLVNAVTKKTPKQAAATATNHSVVQTSQATYFDLSKATPAQNVNSWWPHQQHTMSHQQHATSQQVYMTQQTYFSTQPSLSTQTALEDILNSIQVPVKIGDKYTRKKK
jgi:hypothetical protein